MGFPKPHRAIVGTQRQPFAVRVKDYGQNPCVVPGRLADRAPGRRLPKGRSTGSARRRELTRPD